VGCRYPLSGLVTGSACPECGTSTDESLAYYKVEHPSPRQVAWRLLWPLAVFAAIALFLLLPTLFAFSPSGLDGLDVVAMFAGIGLIFINCVNVAIWTVVTLRDHVPPAYRRRHVFSMFFFGRGVGIAWCVACLGMIAGLCGFGACCISLAGHGRSLPTPAPAVPVQPQTTPSK